MKIFAAVLVAAAASGVIMLWPTTRNQGARNLLLQENNASALAFPGAKAVSACPSTDWKELHRLHDPCVLRSLKSHWPAVKMWTPAIVAREFDKVKVHISKESSVAMFSEVQPFGQVKELRWTRGWTEEEMYPAELFEGKGEGAKDETYNYLYLFLPVEQLPQALQADLGDESLQSLGEKINSIGFWTGRGPSTIASTSNDEVLASPLHYDAAHNAFVQISGRKRFILFPHNVTGCLYVHPRLHPSTQLTSSCALC